MMVYNIHTNKVYDIIDTRAITKTTSVGDIILTYLVLQRVNSDTQRMVQAHNLQKDYRDVPFEGAGL